MAEFKVNIRGAQYKITAPDEEQAATQALKLSQQPQHFELGQAPGDGPLPAGYDPKMGIVSGGAIDDKTGNEFGSGIRQTIESTIGLPGDVGPMAGQGASKLAGQFGVQPEAQGNIADTVSKLTSAMFNPVGAVLPYSNAASTRDIQQAVTDPVLGETGPVLTEKGQVARSSGNFAGGAFAPGGLLGKLLSMALPVAGGEAGAAIAPKGYEDYGRFAGQLAGGAATIPKLGGKPIVEAARDLGVKTKDMTRVIKRMQQDGLTPQQIQAEMTRLGDEATLMDVGPNLRQEGQRIYAQGGSGRGVIDDVLTPRDQGANARIRNEMDANLGPAPVPSKVDAGLKRAQRFLGPEYDRLLNDNAKAVNTEAISNDIESMIANTRGEAKSALEKVRGMLRIEGTEVLDPHPRAALATRQAIDGMMSGTQDSNVRRILGDFRKRLDSEIGTSVPGIKEVDAKYANLAGQREAFERGRSVLDSGRSSPTPVDLAADAAKSPATKFRLSQGARADMDRIVGTNANDRVALQRIIKGEGDWNRDKLGELFGQDKADRMIAVLDREKTFDLTSNKVMKGSATAERLPDGGDAFGMLPSWKSGGVLGLARAALSELGEGFIDKIRSTSAEARDSGVARVISSTDRGRIVTALIKANGGKKLPQAQIESAVRALLLTSGANSQSAK